MKSLQLVALISAIVGIPAQQYSPGALGAFSASAPATTPKPVYPPAQVHYVNIGEDLGGDYKFGYDTGKTGAGQSFREESRLPDGTVKGAYGYVDAEGKQRIVKYTAGVEGFKVDSDEAAPGAGQAPAPAATPVRTYSPPTPAAAPVRTYTPSQPSYAQLQARAVNVPSAQPPAISYQLPAAQQLGGYTPVNQYQASKPAARPALAAPPATPIASAYQNPSQLPTYEDVIKQLNAEQQQAARQVYRPPATTSSVPAYTATLGQTQPAAYSQLARPAVAPAAAPAYARAQSPLVGFGNPTEPQESTTWGPPVINKELLSYNIGVQG